MKYNLETLEGYWQCDLAKLAEGDYEITYANDRAEEFLWNIFHDIIEETQHVSAEDWEREIAGDHRGILNEIADRAVSSYTTVRWEQFTGLGAWRENLDTFDAFTDMNEGCALALFQIGYRLAANLADQITKTIEEN